jgi:DNA repair protein RecO (recombination protein O)
MAAEKAVALVVRGTDWSETSRITTLFTREFGRVRALAKGGRRLKSSFDVAFDLLSVCQVVFLRKASEGLDLLTEARLEERFPALRANLPSLYTGYYIAELLSDGTQDYDPHVVLFDSAIETLRGLGNSSGTPLLAATFFELVWLRELGYSPRLDACVSCSARVGAESAERLAYSPSFGGVLCPECAASVGDRRWITRQAFEELSGLVNETEADRPQARSGPRGVSGEVRQLLGQSVSFVLGRRPRLLGYVDTR